MSFLLFVIFGRAMPALLIVVAVAWMWAISAVLN